MSKQSDLSYFSKPDIYVLDTETTGLKGHPYDFVVDIAICRVSLDEATVEEVYSSIVGHDTSLWDKATREAWIFQNTDMTLEMVDSAPPIDKVVDEVRAVLNGRYVTSFNFDYDFQKFLYHEPWSLRGAINPTACIMRKSMPVCAIPGFYDQYKFPKLQEAYDMIVEGDPAGINGKQTHRALSDAIMASYILIALDRTGRY